MAKKKAPEPVVEAKPKRGRPAGEAFAGTVLSTKIPARLHERLVKVVESSGFRAAEIVRQGLDLKLAELEARPKS